MHRDVNATRCFTALVESRHAADHIAAIDNVTRRLVATGRRPFTVGLFFSLGHCTVVLALCALVIVSSELSSETLEEWASTGSAVGPWVAAVILLSIGSMNACAVRDLLCRSDELSCFRRLGCRRPAGPLRLLPPPAVEAAGA